MVHCKFESFWLRNIHPNAVLQCLEASLEQMQFKPMDRVWFGPILRGRSFWGDSVESLSISGSIPIGKIANDGKRYVAEFEIQPWGPDVFLRVLFMPYKLFPDKGDRFVFAQEILEYITDDHYCEEFMENLIYRLSHMGLKLETCTG
jgi:hypothetical protein